jgi:hypothetical protein
MNDKIRTVRRKSWQELKPLRLIEQALSPRSDRLHQQLRSEERIHPGQERKGGGLRLREDQ